MGCGARLPAGSTSCQWFNWFIHESIELLDSFAYTFLCYCTCYYVSIYLFLFHFSDEHFIKPYCSTLLEELFCNLCSMCHSSEAVGLIKILTFKSIFKKPC